MHISDLGYDAGKRIKGRKRHIVTDRIGLLIGLEVARAGIQDRGGASDVPAAGAARYPMLRHILADCGNADPRLRDALHAIARRIVQIVKRSDTAEGFDILPRRWVGQRDGAKKDALISRQLTERHELQKAVQHFRDQRTKDGSEIGKDIGEYLALKRSDLPRVKDFNEKSAASTPNRTRPKGRDKGFDGPDFTP